MGGRKGIRLVKKWGHGGGGQWLVWMEWRPAGWSECLPLLVFPCTIKSRSSPLAPAHPGGPGKRAVKRLWCGGGISSQICCCRPCFGDFLVFVLIQDELSCLAWWINDQRIAVESIQHNGVLRTQVVSRQTVCLPAQTVVSIRQILQQTNTAYHRPVTANNKNAHCRTRISCHWETRAMHCVTANVSIYFTANK